MTKIKIPLYVTIENYATLCGIGRSTVYNRLGEDSHPLDCEIRDYEGYPTKMINTKKFPPSKDLLKPVGRKRQILAK